MEISPEIISLIDEIRGDRVHGASELARQAANVLKVAAERSRANSAEEFWLEQKMVGEKLMSARPSMAPVFNIVNRLLGAIAGKAAEMNLDSIRRLTVSEADELMESSIQAVAQITEHASELIIGGDMIMTHSYSSTVVTALKEAFTRQGNIGVIATRSGPGRTGERIAQQLGLYGVPVTFIDDAAVGLYVSKANKVLVGADRICADGKIINGIGTYQLALVAERAGIPFYVLCETLKFDHRLRGDEVELEEKEVSEVVKPGILPPEVIVKNPYFDVTPPGLVAGIITENGLLAPQDVISYMEKHPVKDD